MLPARLGKADVNRYMKGSGKVGTVKEARDKRAAQWLFGGAGKWVNTFLTQGAHAI